MASERQIAANRANATRSTGPRSAAGKAKVATNAVRHGLTARRPEPAFEVAARELADGFCAEDPQIDAGAALDLARALLRRQQVTRVFDEMTQDALRGAPNLGPYDLREDLARLAVLQGPGAALADYERRAATALRKALKQL